MILAAIEHSGIRKINQETLYIGPLYITEYPKICKNMLGQNDICTYSLRQFFFFFTVGMKGHLTW
jgi:hypothetical protein